MAWQGVHSVAEILAAGGWRLFSLAPFYLLAPLALDTLSFKQLLMPGVRAFHMLFYANWIGTAINWLLPVAQIGGEVVRARILVHHGVRSAEAVASLVVDKTLQALTLVVYALESTRCA